MRFSRWQSENQKDSRPGRVRIIISDGTCAQLNAQQIKMVSCEACVCVGGSGIKNKFFIPLPPSLCHVFEDRPRIACVHACVPWELCKITSCSVTSEAGELQGSCSKAPFQQRMRRIQAYPRKTFKLRVPGNHRTCMLSYLSVKLEGRCFRRISRR